MVLQKTVAESAYLSVPFSEAWAPMEGLCIRRFLRSPPHLTSLPEEC